MANRNGSDETDRTVQRRVREAAERALAEAVARRRSAPEGADAPREIDGRGGKEPVRYGDWEVRGLASDF